MSHQLDNKQCLCHSVELFLIWKTDPDGQVQVLQTLQN